MATLTVRKLDDDVYERLKIRAKLNGRSLESEVRELIEESAPDPRDIVAMLRVSHERFIGKHGQLDLDGTELIRKVRDEE